mmetsp:Transcript_2689/g.4892  ORF Transcript_2689/g.4892 Transcript_2689/m.4892 type:complete len:357 (-) Transcript_2689:141-1211(-)
MSGIAWVRNVGEALRRSRQTGKPVFLLFIEAPGCDVCGQFGKRVLGNDRLAEAIETLFVPCLVNKLGLSAMDRDASVRFKENKNGNPIVRFFDSQEHELIRRKSNLWYGYEIASRMETVLRRFNGCNGCPEWFSEFRRELDLNYIARTRRSHVERAIFVVDDYFMGQSAVGRLALPEHGSYPIISTRCSHFDLLKTVEVKFDSSQMPFPALLELVKTHVKELKCTVPIDPIQLRISLEIFGMQKTCLILRKNNNLMNSKVDAKMIQNYYVTCLPYEVQFILSERQRLLVNAAIVSRAGDQWKDILSPRQRSMMQAPEQTHLTTIPDEYWESLSPPSGSPKLRSPKIWSPRIRILAS